jgi:hypothetical protein
VVYKGPDVLHKDQFYIRYEETRSMLRKKCHQKCDNALQAFEYWMDIA